MNIKAIAATAAIALTASFVGGTLAQPSRYRSDHWSRTAWCIESELRGIEFDIRTPTGFNEALLPFSVGIRTGKALACPVTRGEFTVNYVDLPLAIGNWLGGNLN